MMRSGTLFRLVLVGLAGVLALPLVVGVLALRGPASGARAADGDPAVVATVPVGSGPVAVAVNPNTNRIYVTNWYSNSVFVIDGASSAVVDTVGVGGGPIGVAVNPTMNLIYVANSSDNSVSVISGASNAVVDTVAVGSYPLAVAVNPTTNRIYVTNMDYSGDGSSVSVIDGASDTVVATIAVGSYPSGVAVNPNTNRIYVANSSNVSVIDGASNTVVATVAVGGGGVAVNPNTNRIYVANSGGVSVIDGASNTVVATVAVGSGPWGVAVSPTSNRIYVVNSGGVFVIGGASNTVVASVAIGSYYPHGVAVNPTTNRIYVTNYGTDFWPGYTVSTVSVVEDPTAAPPTPTPEPCGGLCVAGFWEIGYNGSAVGNCGSLLRQTGANTVSGEESCTQAALGSISYYLDQDTLVATGAIEFQQPAYMFAVSTTYSSDGNSATGTWTCTWGCDAASGTFTGNRIPSHYETPIPASSGGQLSTALNDTLAVPAGALPSDQDVTIDLSALPAAPPEGLTPLARAYTFGPAGLVFSKPVTVIFKYTLNDLAGGSIDPATLRVYIYDPEHRAWDLVGGVVDTLAMTLTVQLDRFSTYAIFGQPPGAPPLPTATPRPTQTPTPPTPAPPLTPTRQPGVGGKVMLPPAVIAAESRGSAGAYAAFAVGLSTAAAALGIGGWYARRRWLR